MIGVDPEDKPFMPFIKKVVKPDQLDAVLPLANVVFVSAPHTPASNKMMGSREFDLMKPNSLLHRGQPRRLVRHERAGQVARQQTPGGSRVDVTDPSRCPRLTRFGVSRTRSSPRTSQDSRIRFEGRIIATIRENIARFADGRPSGQRRR